MILASLTCPSKVYLASLRLLGKSAHLLVTLLVAAACVDIVNNSLIQIWLLGDSHCVKLEGCARFFLQQVRGTYGVVLTMSTQMTIPSAQPLRIQFVVGVVELQVTMAAACITVLGVLA
ncbi:hypothetical protein DFJ58DRAFT_132450 [Suillus subalutaceus]|uniref:uncharacterized protein n=1 Tax=Suillus subalutaceus TaxID=48586 RepID=UPI001B881E1D|nr:uncharacterized protein DFJ58DRAFT_132450 [Suillus subalutaceus]KAG1838280.1 hypothetical protein DFJ58DRAFT_132450 [Suillus subalutaceus]